mgnify:CR=1 FL=1
MNETETTQGFAPPKLGGAQRNIGKSSIDLSDSANEKQMWNEYHNFRKMDRGWNRDNLESTWFDKYFGLSKEDYDQQRKAQMKPGFLPAGQRAQNLMENFNLPAQAMADFVFDVVGNVPGLARVDDIYDDVSKYDDPTKQRIRNVLSVVLPSIWGGAAVGGKVAAMKAPAVQKALVGTGLFAAEEAAVIGLSDQGDEDNLFRTMADFFPDTFGPKGTHPLPDAIVTLDGDSSAVRKKKNMYETAGLSIVSSALSAFIRVFGKKRIMDWFVPKDTKALKYKQLNLIDTAEPDKLIRAQEINEVLSTKSLSKQNEQMLMDELMTINEELGIVDSIDDEVRRARIKKQRETDAAVKNKIDKAEQLELSFDPDFAPGVVTEPAEARQIPPSGNVARNMADTTGIKTGTSAGDPAPVITESMQRKGLMVGPTSRSAVMGVAEEGREAGRFDALVDGFRFSAKQMNAAAWDIYTSIMAAENMDDLRGLFLENRDVKNMLLGRFKVEMFNEEQARAAAFAMRDLVDRYLGREVTESSARVMDTLGREAATIAESIQTLTPFVDDNRAMDLIIDKMQFLMDEYGLNKYVSGWQLRNKNWFDQVPPKELDTVIEQLTTEFRSAENAIHAKNLKFTKTLKELKEKNPKMMRPLVDAYAHTNGDVDSIAKLHKWAAEQITPLGLLKSPNPKQMNLFARGTWGVIYNNVLSGLSAFRAGIGNTSQLILKPITGILGHGFNGLLTGEWDGLKATFYYNGAIFETNRRALNDAFHMMKRAHKDPQTMMKAYRKDFIVQESKSWDILDSMRPVWESEGNWGRVTQYDVAKLMRDLGEHPALRYGMTGMVFPDVFSQVHLAHYLSRTRAYSDVFSEFGYIKPGAIEAAEAKHYKEMFDADGMVKDKALKAISGEVALNLDDGVANWINQATTAYPITKHMLMFPRTSSNYIKNSASWTPISLIPGINKYSKTIWAESQEEIAAALLEHGIDMASTPNALALFKNLQAEYKGRMAFSGLMTATLYQYAMSGNIRGNGHYNASRRNKERTQMGYEPKTINIGGKWVSYKGILGIEQVLSVIGDIAYYNKDIDEATLANLQAKLTWTLSATFLNETPLQGLEPLIAATNGDLSGWNRLLANAARAYIPLSGAAGVLSSAITSTQKDIQGNLDEYLKNRLPILSSTLPDQIDIWTGEPVNDIDNPFLRILNSLSPLKVSGTAEPWRQWLLETGWNGLGRLRKDSTGSYEYTPEERELIYKFIGEQQLYKQVERLMKDKKYKKDIETLRIHRSNNAEINQDRVKLDTQHLPVHQELNWILRRAQKVAEERLQNLRPDIKERIDLQREANFNMKRGNVKKAAKVQKEAQLKQLLEINK